MSQRPSHRGEAICHNCESPLDWGPESLNPGEWYVCTACERSLLGRGAMIRLEEFVGEFPLFTTDADGTEVQVV